MAHSPDQESEIAAMQARAAVRRKTMIVHKGRFGDEEVDLCPIRGEAAVDLALELTVEQWALAGFEMPDLARHELPYRFVPYDD